MSANSDKWHVGEWLDYPASLLTQAEAALTSQDMDTTNNALTTFWSVIQGYWQNAGTPAAQGDMYTLTGKALWLQGHALQVYQGQLIGNQASSQDVQSAGDQAKKAFSDSQAALAKAQSAYASAGVDTTVASRWAQTASDDVSTVDKITAQAVQASKDTQPPGILDILKGNIPGLNIPLWIVPAAGIAVFFLPQILKSMASGRR